MNDNELRGTVLSHFYGRRREGFIMPQPQSFALPSTVQWKDVLRICEQLGAQGLIDWKSQEVIGEEFSNGFGKITPQGVDVIEHLTQARDRSTVTYDNRQYVFNRSNNNIIGDDNVQIGGINT